jgi:hypothetical protein
LDSINLGFLLREKRAAVLIIPSSWGSKLDGELHHQHRGASYGYNVWTKHEERGVMMEDGDEEENDDDNYRSMFPEYADTAMEDNEDKGQGEERAPDEPADDLGRVISDARRGCDIEKERLQFEQMLLDHNKLLYPTCEDGQKKLGSTLELLKWKA